MPDARTEPHRHLGIEAEELTEDMTCNDLVVVLEYLRFDNGVGLVSMDRVRDFIVRALRQRLLGFGGDDRLSCVAHAHQACPAAPQTQDERHRCVHPRLWPFT